MNRKSSLLAEMAVHAALLLAVCAALYPVLWVVSLAFDPAQSPEPRAIPLPSSLRFDSGGGFLKSLLALPTDNFRAVVMARDGGGHLIFFRQLANSLLVSGATAAVSVAIATPAAYALARFRFVGADASMKVLLATQMFPGVATAVPLYMILDLLHLLDTRTGLALVYATTAVPFAVFQLRGAFESIPRDLEEAAMVDGATRWQAFTRVVLPAARPALAVTALFAFMSAWNEFILAATFLSREDAFTLPVSLQRYIGEYDAAWGKFAAGAIIVSLPVMLIFYALQRQLVGGLTAGGVKG